MKRVLSGIIFSVLVTLAILSCYNIAVAEMGGYLWIVDAPSGANVRDAHTGGNVVCVFRKGYVFRVVSEDQYKIATILSDGSTGYIFKELCHIAHAEEIEEWEKKQREGIELTYEDCYFVGEIKEDCNVYRQPNGKIIGEFKTGEAVYVRKLGQFWYRIIYDNKKISYVQASKVKLLDVNIPGEGYAAIVRDKDDATEGTFVVREEPNTSSQKVTTLKENTYIKVVDNSREDGWYLVAYNVQGDMGYINKKWLIKVTSIFN